MIDQNKEKTQQLKLIQIQIAFLCLILFLLLRLLHYVDDNNQADSQSRRGNFMTSSSQQSDLYGTAAITPDAETLRLKVLRVIPGAVPAVQNNEAPLSHRR